jgi:hypothetical protein
MNKPVISKEELPLASDAEILATTALFEACRLPYKHWTHRAHLAVAVSYAWQYDYDTALQRIREAINNYNHKCGQPDGYNETVTIMFLRKIFAEVAGRQQDTSMHAALGRIVGLCTLPWLLTYYSRELLWSGTAKSAWVEPDLKRVDF